MKTIYKYELQIIDEQVIYLPPDYKILSVQMQKDKLCMWALVKSNDMITTEVKIKIYGTGHPVEEDGQFLGTFQAYSGDFVGHVFEIYQ